MEKAKVANFLTLQNKYFYYAKLYFYFCYLYAIQLDLDYKFVN